jgi:hypothetical protein
MTISATAVRFDERTMWVDLTDGRTPFEAPPDQVGGRTSG